MNDAMLIQRLTALEQQVRLLSQAAGIACPPFPSDGGVPTEVLALVASGKKVQAIQLVRQLTGASLAEAKAIVDSL